MLRKQGWESGSAVVKIDFALSAHVRAQELNLRSPHIGVGQHCLHSMCGGDDGGDDGGGGWERLVRDISRMRNAGKVGSPPSLALSLGVPGEKKKEKNNENISQLRRLFRGSRAAPPQKIRKGGTETTRGVNSVLGRETSVYRSAISRWYRASYIHDAVQKRFSFTSLLAKHGLSFIFRYRSVLLSIAQKYL